MNRVFQPNRTWTATARPPQAFVGMNSPWGQVDSVTCICPGIWSVSTSGHGGVYLDEPHNAQVPASMRANDGWYEEDCDWSIPFCVFEQEIKAQCKEAFVLSQLPKGEHWKTLKNRHPEAWEKLTGRALQPGESRVRDEETWHQAHKHDLIVVSAFGSWHQNVPQGMVGVLACVGGRNEQGRYAGKLRQFLVPAEEYQSRTENPGYGFVVDPSRHQESKFYIEEQTQ